MNLIDQRDSSPPLSWRERIRGYLDSPTTLTGRVLNGAIAVLILLSAIIFVVETYSIPEALHQSLRVLDWLVVIAFSGEYLIRLWAAEQPWRYGASLYGLLDLVAILPSWLGLFDVRFLRLLRWLRLLRLVRLFEKGHMLGPLSGADGLALTQILIGLGATIFIYSGLIFQVEHTHNPENFRTFFDALYFAIVTMTTVGYGDMTPTSDAGRGLTLMMILTGIALIPPLVSRLIRQVAKVTSTRQQPCVKCGLATHDTDARFCKQCGTLLPADGPGEPGGRMG